MLLDTTPDIEARQVEIWRKMGGEQRLLLGFEMSQMARNLTKCCIRSEHPDWSDLEIKHQIIRQAFLPHSVPEWLEKKMQEREKRERAAG